jgi:hypothetical protein
MKTITVLLFIDIPIILSFYSIPFASIVYCCF